MFIKTNLKVYQFNNFNLINKFSASLINSQINYVFFLNQYARYIADCFIIENLKYLITTENIINNLNLHLKKYDLRNTLIFEQLNLNVYYSDLLGFKDPRNLMNIYFTNEEVSPCDSEDFYLNLKMNNLIAEFNDFVFEKSNLFEFGNAYSFVNKNECYLGQESFNYLQKLPITNKLKISNQNNGTVFFEYNNNFLIKV